MQLKNRDGFTLIEVLIVVLIISILSGVALSLLNSGGYRQKARDSQRVADLRKIQTALELYFQDNRRYPSSPSFTDSSSSLSALVPNYISALPADPTYSAGSSQPCSDYNPTAFYYAYRTTASDDRYILLAHMETATASTSLCSSLSNWASLGCASAPSVCYGVQNP